VLRLTLTTSAPSAAAPDRVIASSPDRTSDTVPQSLPAALAAKPPNKTVTRAVAFSKRPPDEIIEYLHHLNIEVLWQQGADLLTGPERSRGRMAPFLALAVEGAPAR
jgi:hypothetical protein